MSSGGSISAMITSLKNNKNVRRLRKSMSEKRADNAGEFNKDAEPLVYKNKMSVEERALYLVKLKKKNRKTVITYLTVTLAVITFLFLMALVIHHL